MSNLKAVLRALILALLLGTGLWLMDQIAQTSMAGKSQSLPSLPGPVSANPAPSQPQTTPAGDISHPGKEAGAQGGNAGATPTPVTPAGDIPVPSAGEHDAGQSGAPAKEPATAKGAASDSGQTQEQGSAPHILRRADGQYVATEPILFSTASSLIRPVSIQPLKKVGAFLKERPDLRLMIVGYTDSLGLPENNLRVSARRAAAVREFLVSEGIDPSRLESQGMGSQNPIASNDTQLGRQANRRIEFVIASPR